MATFEDRATNHRYLIFKLLKISMIQKIYVTALDRPIHIDFLHVFDLKITERKLSLYGKKSAFKFFSLYMKTTSLLCLKSESEGQLSNAVSIVLQS